jgi:hypothetical protein
MKQMQLVRRISALAFTGALLLGGACSDDDPTGPSAAQVVGTYNATKFTATGGGIAINVLEQGGSLTMTFAANGTVTGHVTLPGDGIDEDVDEDFAGRWKIDDGEVEIEELSGDNVVEDLKFSVVGNTLVADRTIDNVRVQVTMTKN